MKVRTFALLFVLMPVVASAQILVTPNPARVQQRQIRAEIHDPSMYIYDEYRSDGATYQMHSMDDFALGAYNREAMTDALQGLASDRRGNVYGVVWVGSVVRMRIGIEVRPDWRN